MHTSFCVCLCVQEMSVRQQDARLRNQLDACSEEAILDFQASMHSPTHRSFHAPINQYIHPPMHPSVYPHEHVIHPFIHSSIHVYIHVSIHPSIHTSIHQRQSWCLGKKLSECWNDADLHTKPGSRRRAPPLSPRDKIYLNTLKLPH